MLWPWLHPAPHASVGGRDIYSIPFFCHPQPHMKLDALSQCVPAGESPVDEPITAGEYLNERLTEIGLKSQEK